MIVEYEETYNEGQSDEYSLEFRGDYHEEDETTGFRACATLGSVFYTSPNLGIWIEVTPFFFELVDGQFDVEKIEEILATK